MFRALALFAGALAGCLLLSGPASLFFHAAIENQKIALPRTMYWAWERPEDLRFLTSGKQGVAFLARTIELRQLPADKAGVTTASAREIWFGRNPAMSVGVNLKPRLQPLQVGKGTPLMSVVRIETTNDLWHRPEERPEGTRRGIVATSLYSEHQRQAVADMVVAAARLPRVKALQIDFDASQSEQPFYAALLQDVRTRLPEGMPLSITALASWCIFDTWLDHLPAGTIDEAVPMLFRMGPNATEVASFVESGREFPSSVCRESLGLSTDERFSQAVLRGAISRNQPTWPSRRIYVFSPAAWGRQEVSTVTSEVARWHND